MKFSNQSLNKVIHNIFSNNEYFKIAAESDEKNIHQILESVGMVLTKKIKVLYTRRPSLWKSFTQATQKTMIYMAKDGKSFMSALSESQVKLNGELKTSYYTSDLRMTKETPVKTRVEFKKLYGKVVAEISDFCYTAIFNSNKIAMRSLTAKKNVVKYNKLTEYMARTFFVLPGFNSSPFKVTSVTEANHSSYVSYLKNKTYALEHLNPYNNHYLIYKGDTIIGCFSVIKPENKCLIIDSSSKWINSILWLNKVIRNKNNGSSLSWKYITHLQVNNDVFNDSFVKYFIKSLRKAKTVSTGELVVMIYSPNQCNSLSNKMVAGCPQLTNRSTLFQVELQQTDRTLNGKILLDPNQL